MNRPFAKSNYYFMLETPAGITKAVLDSGKINNQVEALSSESVIFRNNYEGTVYSFVLKGVFANFYLKP